MLTPVGPYSLRDFTSVLLSSMLSFIPYNLEIENVSVIMSDQIITQRRVDFRSSNQLITQGKFHMLDVIIANLYISQEFVELYISIRILN